MAGWRRPCLPERPRALRRSADASWKAEVGREVERILALPDPLARMQAHAELARVLAEEGEALPPEAADRILLSLRSAAAELAREERRRRREEADRAEERRPVRPDAGVVKREERRRRWEAEWAEQEWLARLRPLAAWVGVPVATVLPLVLMAARGWGPGGVLAALARLLLDPGSPTLGAAVALCGAAACAWWAGRARDGDKLLAALAAALVCGAALAAAAAQGGKGGAF